MTKKTLFAALAIVIRISDYPSGWMRTQVANCRPIKVSDVQAILGSPDGFDEMFQSPTIVESRFFGKGNLIDQGRNSPKVQFAKEAF